MSEPNTGSEIFTDSERDAIATSLFEAFRASLKPGERFRAAGQLEDERLTVTVELAGPEREEVQVFEAGHEVHAESELDLVAARAHAVEFLGGMIHRYLKDGRWPHPHLDWKAYTFEGIEVFFRGAVRNDKLEAMADALLAEGQGEADE